MSSNRRGIWLWVLLSTACGQVRTPTEPVGQEPVGTSVPSLAQLQTEIFSPVCARAGCHGAPSPILDLDLSAGHSFASLVGVAAAERPELLRVEPGNAERSYLLKKLRGDSDIVGGRMPFGEGPLRPDQIAAVAAWVGAGAPAE